MLKEPDQPCMDVIISPDHSAFSLKAIREYAYEIVNSFYDGGDKDQQKAARNLGNFIFDMLDYPWTKPEFLGMVEMFQKHPRLRNLLLSAVPDLAMVVPIQAAAELVDYGPWDYDRCVSRNGEFRFVPGEPQLQAWKADTPEGLRWDTWFLVQAMNKVWGYFTTFDGFPHSGDFGWRQGKGAVWSTFYRSPAPSPEPAPVTPAAPAVTKKLVEQVPAAAALPAPAPEAVVPTKAAADLPTPTAPADAKPTPTTVWIWACVPVQVVPHVAATSSTAAGPSVTAVQAVQVAA
jgi:hypothetical protein